MARRKKLRIKRFKPRFYFFVALIFAIIFYSILIINRPKNEDVEKRIVFHEDQREIFIDDITKVGYTIYESDELNQITWSTSNQNIAKVDSKGNITGVSFGDVQITATLENGASDTMIVRVKSYDVSLRVEVNDAIENSGWYNKQISVEVSTINIKYIKYCVTKEEICVPDKNYQKSIIIKKGIWNLYLTGLDNNNRQINYNETFRVDTDAPKCEVTNIGKKNEAHTVVSVSCVPDDSKILRYEWYRDEKLVYTTDKSEILMSEIIAEGSHKYKVKVFDSALNSKTYGAFD